MATSASLASGQLPATKGTLYTATGGIAITLFRYTSSTGANRIVNAYLKLSAGVSCRLIPKSTPLAGTDTLKICDDSQEIRMSAGDTLEGDADAAADVDYVITGVPLP